MATTLDLRLKTEGWERGLNRLTQRFPQAVSRALSRSATSARVVMVRAVAADLGLKQADVQVHVVVKVGTEFLKADEMKAQVIATGARIGLYKFKARQTKTGVSARLPGGVGRYPGAFIARMHTGHVGVFKRAGRTRLPIRELFGPSIPKVFEKFIPMGLARGQEQLAKNLVHEFRFALSQSAA